MFSFNDVMCFCILVIYSQKPGFLAFESSRGQKWLSAIIQRQLNSKASVNSGFGPSGEISVAVNRNLVLGCCYWHLLG